MGLAYSCFLVVRSSSSATVVRTLATVLPDFKTAVPPKNDEIGKEWARLAPTLSD